VLLAVTAGPTPHWELVAAFVVVGLICVVGLIVKLLRRGKPPR
jgi:hypothetical protein